MCILQRKKFGRIDFSTISKASIKKYKNQNCLKIIISKLYLLYFT